MKENELIQALVNCVETSNLLLNSYHKETPAGTKALMIKKMIDTNSIALVSALEYEGEQTELFAAEETYIGRFFAIPVEQHDQAIALLTEVRDCSTDEKKIYDNLVEAIKLLTE